MVGTSFAAGALLARAGSTATVAVVNDPQTNVIAELDGRRDDNIVMSGAHLDSVEAGPGINDNSSGSAALLELAEQLRELQAAQHATARVVGRRGSGSGRVDGIRRGPERRLSATGSRCT